jgi:hypothetical protein
MSSTDTSRKAIKDAYDKGMFEIQKILFSINSTAAQRKVARKSLDDLTAMLLAHTLITVAGRTAILSGLIVELNEVIAKVKTKPPSGTTLADMTGVLTKAQKLYASEKAGLLLEEVLPR